MLGSDIKKINEAYFNACNFESFMRGIHFALFISALSKIYTKPKRARPTRLGMSILVMLFFLMPTIHNAAFWAYVRWAFITHGETAESTAKALGSYPVWFIGTTSVSDANAVLADCLIVKKFFFALFTSSMLITSSWIDLALLGIMGKSWKVTITPVICTMLTTVFSVIAIYKTTKSTTFGDLKADFATALYSTSLVTTMYCTGMIIYPIVQTGVRSRASHGLRSYRGAIEIIVESSALYCLATLFVLVAYISSGPASEYASAFWASMTGIAPTLLIARVAAGSTQPDQTWNDGNDPRQGPTLSFLTFAANRTPSNRVGVANKESLTFSNHSNVSVNQVQTAAAAELVVAEFEERSLNETEKSVV